MPYFAQSSWLKTWKSKSTGRQSIFKWIEKARRQGCLGGTVEQEECIDHWDKRKETEDKESCIYTWMMQVEGKSEGIFRNFDDSSASQFIHIFVKVRNILTNV